MCFLVAVIGLAVISATVTNKFFPLQIPVDDANLQVYLQIYSYSLYKWKLKKWLSPTAAQ